MVIKIRFLLQLRTVDVLAVVVIVKHGMYFSRGGEKTTPRPKANYF